MKLLFLSHWGYNDPLTVATVLPHLKTLTDSGKFEKIILCTIEREKQEDDNHELSHGVKHVAIRSGQSLAKKVGEFLKVPNLIKHLCKQQGIDKIICRGAVAGTIGYLVSRKTDIPFYVESYEPHAEYMHQSNVWKKWSPQYVLQKYWQTKQLTMASGIMTVSNAYANKLIEEGLDTRKVRSVPCAIELAKYCYDPSKRREIREKLGFSTKDLIAIYVGKFGGLYYDTEAFELFKSLSDMHEHFRLIVLSPGNILAIHNKLENTGFDSQNCFINTVQPSEVAAYLSASDFGICTHRSHQYSMGFSPVKNGEYWANGLPVLIANGVGDDSAIAVNKSAGALFTVSDAASIKQGFQTILNIINDPNSRVRIPLVAKEFRSPKAVYNAYKYFFFDT